MNLILSARERLQRAYGSGGARRVLAAIDQLAQARTTRGMQSRLLLIEDGLPELSVAAATAEPAAIANQVAAAAQALVHNGERLESVLIVGGAEIVPFELVPNPAPYDGDEAVPSDVIYGARNPATLIDEWPVGRLPGAASANPSLLVRLLLNSATLHRRGLANAPMKTFGYSAGVWQQAARTVYAEASDVPPILSPPTVAATLDRSLIDGAGLVYCNLHGVRDGPIWYGQPDGRSGLFVALRPKDIRLLDLRGAVVISEACYGAAVVGRDERDSLALSFLGRGAACFVGATAIAYGPSSSPLSEADLLSLHFLRALKSPDATLGGAFATARVEMLRETLRRQAELDQDDRKTALEFVLYGDPTLTSSYAL